MIRACGSIAVCILYGTFSAEETDVITVYYLLAGLFLVFIEYIDAS